MARKKESNLFIDSDKLVRNIQKNFFFSTFENEKDEFEFELQRAVGTFKRGKGGNKEQKWLVTTAKCQIWLVVRHKYIKGTRIR